MSKVVIGFVAIDVTTSGSTLKYRAIDFLLLPESIVDHGDGIDSKGHVNLQLKINKQRNKILTKNVF